MLKLTLLLLFLFVSGVLSNDVLISEHPISVIDCEGRSVFISISAESISGNKILYQWYKDNKIIPSETSKVLNFSELKHSNSGMYFCRVSNEVGSEFTDSKYVAVFAQSAVSITSEPQDVLIYGFKENVFINFEAHINGNSVNGKIVKIQWYQVNGKNNIQLEDDNVFNGSKTNRLSVNIDDLPNITSFFAVIEGRCGIDTTRVATINKNYKGIELNLNESSFDACDCQQHSMKVEVKNPNNYKLDYQWYKNGKPLFSNQFVIGTNNDELIFNSVSKSDEGNYSVEVRAKEINYTGKTNEIKLKVLKKPEIVAVRIDSLTSSATIPYPDLNIYFKNDDSTNITTYKDDKYYFSYKNTYQKYYYEDFEKIRNISYQISQLDSNSKYWSIASNKCGKSFSDTLTIKDNLNEFENRDPWNQFHKLCENQSVTFELYFVNSISTWWTKPPFAKNIIFLRDDYNFQGTSTNKLRINKIEKKNEGFYSFFVRYYSDIDTNLKYDMSPGFVLYVKPIPNINKQPENKNLVNGQMDTLLQVGFDNIDNNGIEVSLYKIKDKNSLPELIDKTDYGIIGNYSYVKNINFSDDGLYFALVRHKNDCKAVSTDTIKVNVIPKGIVSSIEENELKPNLSIQPNPASDFINIQFSNKGLQPFAENVNVQIFNTLGIEVAQTPPSVIIGQTRASDLLRIDISNLPAGVYFIRIGDRVEKFVKI